jgi:DNA-binding NarL/FixJ family response regulator
VVVLDYRLPDISGHEVCRSIKQAHPGVHVVFLSSYAAAPTVRGALEAGATGYLLKENRAGKIVDAILAACEGGTVIDPMLAHDLFLKPPSPGGSATQNFEKLSPQEAKVLKEIAAGKTNKEVADALGLQPNTVRNYLDHIFVKLGVHTRTEAAVFYHRATSPPE